MLLEVLQGPESGFTLLLDSVDITGRYLLKGFVNAALKREETVHVLEMEVSEGEFTSGLDIQFSERVHIHNGFADPSEWLKRSSFTVHQFTTQYLQALSPPAQQAKPAVLVIDSLTWIIRHLDVLVVCKRLQELKRLGTFKTIVALLHSDLHQCNLIRSVCHLANTVISLSPAIKGHVASAKTTKRTKSGKVLQEEELFSVQEDLTVTVHSKVSHTAMTPAAEGDDAEPDPTAKLTFNLRLSDMEREAKEKLALPFVFSHEKKSAMLNPRHGAGRIVYEPDAYDDFDQEDPDDDLDV